MINVLSDKQVQKIIKRRKRKFKLNNDFYVLTSLNHVFYFWNDGFIGILNQKYELSRQPRILRLYGAEYNSRSSFISSPTIRNHLYELFINNSECLFFIEWHELKQELQNRGLV